MAAPSPAWGDFKVNLLTLSFPGKLEQAFQKDHFQESLRHARIALLLGIFFYAIFGLLDVWIVPEAKQKLWFIRYALVCPFILAVFLFSYSRHFKRYMQLSIASVILAAGLGIIAMILIAPSPGNYLYYAGLILVFIYGYTFFKLRFIWATLAGLMIVIAYEIAAIWLSQTPIPVLVNNNFFFLSGNILGMFACYSIELYSRKDFMQARLLEAEREKVDAANRELEKRVEERTAQLVKTNEELKQEIAERRQAEEALRDSEERYRNLSGQSREAIYITSREGKFAYVNHSFLDLFGYTSEEIIDLKAQDAYVNLNDRLRFQQEIEQRGSIRDFEVKLQKKDGTGMDCLNTATVRRANDGSILGYQGIIRDITEHKRADEEIKEYSKNLEHRVEERTRELNQALRYTEEARDRIEGILKSVADGLIVTDMYNRIILINRAAEDLLGVRFSEVIDRPIDFAIQDKTLKDCIKTTLEKEETGYQVDFELPGEGTKHPRVICARTSVIQDKDGKKSGIITIMPDVTHEREVDKMKTEFISTAAHELRTPLTSIQGFSEILMTRDDIEEKEKEKFLSYINKQSVNLGNIITDLLDISRIESGLGFSLNKAPCNIADIISGAITPFREQFLKHQFQVVLPEGSVELMVDKEKIEQVLENFLSNAVKYAPEGGLIRVTGELSEEHYQVSIEDPGIGMTREQVEKIFDKFYRADASHTATPGTGLGMSIVKYLVEAHGGKVWVESELGKGTTVRFIIPREL